MAFTALKLDLHGLILFTPKKFSDARGTFMETYRQNEFAEFGVTTTFVQENHAASRAVGTIRGMHYQRPPHAQAKLVRVTRGSILDVCIDLRSDSETFGKWTGVKLTSAGASQLFVPRGFAHGYCTLEPDSEITYKCDGYYSPEAEGGVLFSDPAIGIDWPVAVRDAVVSEKDLRLPPLSELNERPFP